MHSWPAGHHEGDTLITSCQHCGLVSRMTNLPRNGVHQSWSTPAGTVIKAYAQGPTAGEYERIGMTERLPECPRDPAAWAARD